MRSTYILFLYFINLYSNRSEELHNYIWGTYNQTKGNIQEAHYQYMHLFKSGCSSYVYKGYIPFLEKIGQYTKIIRLIPKVEDRFKDDAEIQLIFVRALENTGNFRDARKKIKEIGEKFKTNKEIMFLCVDVYFKERNYKKALALIEKYLNNSSLSSGNYVFYYLKAKVYFSLHNNKKALKNIKTSLKEKATFDRAWLLYAVIKEQEKDIRAAIKGYNNYLKLNPKDKAIKKQLEILKNEKS